MVPLSREAAEASKAKEAAQKKYEEKLKKLEEELELIEKLQKSISDKDTEKDLLANESLNTLSKLYQQSKADGL